jgi:nucleotide-binding universal stress UspA family protein
MSIIESEARVAVKNTLYLTDFSQPSEAALPFVVGIARNYGAIVHALHVLTLTRYTYKTPEVRVAEEGVHERLAQLGMHEVDSKLSGVAHKTIVAREIGVGPAVEQAIKDNDADLIALGTHGRTGTRKLLLGSVAEEVFRRSPVPVLTIGPGVYGGAHTDARFRRVLFATDFEHDSQTALLYATSLAQREQGELILLHVINGPQRKEGLIVAPSVAEAMHELYELIPERSQSGYRLEAIVRYGEPSKQIIETAKLRCADLIVLGLHDHASNLETATHLENTTAHKVVVHAACPVLTVRSTDHKTLLN